MNLPDYGTRSMNVIRSRFVAATMISPEIALVTVPNVELLEVGENWETSTGVFTWSVEHLQAAVAAQADPSIRTPIVKLGHVDARFDGQPAVGRIENMRLTNNDQTLVGDLVGVPLWLAECMASAFPRRSIEGFFDFPSRTGNTWAFALTAVALLGEAYPAIDTLEDVAALYGKEPPVFVPVDENTAMVAAERAGKTKVATPVRASDPPAPVAASSVSVNDLVTAFYDGPGGEPGRYWWWIREVLIDPNELVVDDDEGHLFTVTYAVGDGGEFTFGEPQEVRIEYVNVAAARARVKYGNPVAAGRPRTRRAASAADPTEKEHDVKLTEAQLAALGLGPDATDDEISTALDAKLTAPVEPPAPAPETPPAPEVTPPAPAPAPTGDVTPPPEGGPQVPDGMVLVDAAAWAEVRENAALARLNEERRVERERSDVLDGAIKAGKFPKSRREHYASLMQLDPEGTKQAIEALASNVIPVEERGTVGTEGSTPTEGPQYPETWAPTVAAARRSTSSRVKVVSD